MKFPAFINSEHLLFCFKCLPLERAPNHKDLFHTSCCISVMLSFNIILYLLQCLRGCLFHSKRPTQLCALLSFPIRATCRTHAIILSFIIIIILGGIWITNFSLYVLFSTPLLQTFSNSHMFSSALFKEKNLTEFSSLRTVFHKLSGTQFSSQSLNRFANSIPKRISSCASRKRYSW